MIRGVAGVKKSIHPSWLGKGLGIGLLCWDFKGVQEEIPREEASTLQIGSVAFSLEKFINEKMELVEINFRRMNQYKQKVNN